MLCDSAAVEMLWIYINMPIGHSLFECCRLVFVGGRADLPSSKDGDLLCCYIIQTSSGQFCAI